MGANVPASMFYKIIEWRRIHFSLSLTTLVHSRPRAFLRRVLIPYYLKRMRISNVDRKSSNVSHVPCLPSLNIVQVFTANLQLLFLWILSIVMSYPNLAHLILSSSSPHPLLSRQFKETHQHHPHPTQHLPQQPPQRPYCSPQKTSAAPSIHLSPSISPNAWDVCPGLDVLVDVALELFVEGVRRGRRGIGRGGGDDWWVRTVRLVLKSRAERGEEYSV